MRQLLVWEWITVLRSGRGFAKLPANLLVHIWYMTIAFPQPRNLKSKLSIPVGDIHYTKKGVEAAT